VAHEQEEEEGSVIFIYCNVSGFTSHCCASGCLFSGKSHRGELILGGPGTILPYDSWGALYGSGLGGLS
jgi:hypothetical protein